MKKLLFFICILLQISRLSYSQVQVTQPYIFKSYIQSPVYKISTTDTAASKKAVRDTAAAIRSSITNNTITLTSNILEADNTLKTFKPFTSKQAGLNFYTGTTDPDETTRLNLNGKLYTSGISSSVASSYAVTGYSQTGIGGYFRSDGTSSANYSLLVDLNGALTENRSNVALKINRLVSGTYNTTGDLISITDNPSTSGTISGSVLKATIGSTVRLDFNPRVAATGTAYIFSTHNNLTSGGIIMSFRNGSTGQVAYIDHAGTLYADGGVRLGNVSAGYYTNIQNTQGNFEIFSNSVVRTKLLPETSDGASAVAYLFDTHNALSTAGAKLASFKNQGTEKFAIDKDGYLHGDCPHAKSMFMDSSITINLDQNTWYQITNQTSKSTWPATMFTGFTDSGDTVTASHSGHYRLFYHINTSGVNNNIYEYRVMKKSGATSLEVWRYQVTGTGTRVLRIIETSIALTAGDKYWSELRSTSVAPGDVTIYGGQMTIEPIHLDL